MRRFLEKMRQATLRERQGRTTKITRYRQSNNNNTSPRGESKNKSGFNSPCDKPNSQLDNTCEANGRKRTGLNRPDEQHYQHIDITQKPGSFSQANMRKKPDLFYSQNAMPHF